ncbi:MAG: nucleotidyltransferase [Geobacteraceae bacterium]|nr:nucleotidyltransferase [Geobacteraceae bacterium]
MNNQDIRWRQRFSHYQKALLQLSNAVELSRQRPLPELEVQGLIQAFEFTHELAWNVMKDYFEYQGNTSITGSRDATREAFRRNLIIDGEGWMEMIQSRNQTSHAYNREIAREISEKVTDVYHGLFMAFENRMQDLKNAD